MPLSALIVDVPSQARVFRKSQRIVIKQGHTTKRVKNGWQTDQKSMKGVTHDETKGYAASKDQHDEKNQLAGVDAGPRAKSLSNSFTEIQDKSEGLRLNVTVTY